MGELSRLGLLTPAKVSPKARFPRRKPVVRLAEVMRDLAESRARALIYLDTSAVLARLFAAGCSPPEAFWSQAFVSSRLLEFVVFNRVHASGTGPSCSADARHFLGRVHLLALSARVLARAILPFPLPVRSLDALHLATMEFLRGQGQTLKLASYDLRRAADAKAPGFRLAEL